MKTNKITAEEALESSLISAEQLKKSMIEKWENSPIILEIFEQIKNAASLAKFEITREFEIEDFGSCVLISECLSALGYKASYYKTTRPDWDKQKDYDKKVKEIIEKVGEKAADNMGCSRGYLHQKQILVLEVSWL